VAAQQGQAHILRGNGEKTIAVWRSESSADAGTRLVNAGQSDLALRYIACGVPPGTRVVVLPGGYSTHRVMVIDGKFRGCEGNVYSWDLSGDKKERQAASKVEMEKHVGRWKAEADCDKKAQNVYDETLQGRTSNVIAAIDAQKNARADCMTKHGFTDTSDHMHLRMERWSKDESECGMRSGLVFDKYEQCLSQRPAK
jgi:hypothetical protein